MDAFHEGEEVRFRWLDDIIGDIGPSGLTGRLLNDIELLLISAEEPPTFTLVGHDGNWRRAMLEEMKAIEKNETWQLIDPPPGCRPIGLKWVYKVKRDEHGAMSSTRRASSLDVLSSARASTLRKSLRR